MSDFTFSDLGRVHWGSTLKLTAARGFFAGLVWAIILSFGQTAAPGGTVIAWPFIWAVAALPLALLLQFVGMIFGAIMPLLGLWFNFIGSLIICIGDPIVYLINRSFPSLLNIADLSFLNFRPMIFITYPD
ncbi:hypothetical protein [Stappia sp. ES.058]|uniref:hypothetical protein n=1 Tax=Stappia sp. ES.058 TaxID=1881061 RepID=UPI00087ADB3E|nr:hypothetical protein [Stappia sp. ES.058]SDU00361.1 hypothetical protein SAMN05428979_1043 [Stappia sp. ES.058]